MALHPKSDSEGIYMTEAEYLKTELAAEIRHQYINGYAYAMAGAKRNHRRITANILGEFRHHLKGMPCEAFSNDTRVTLGKDYVYPDVVVDCDNTEGDEYSVNAPVIIVEVLSKSTRKFDSSTKLVKYINLPTLKEYVLIEQDIVAIQVLRKSNDWKHEFYSLGDAITFESIDLTLTVEDIYDRVDNNEMREFRQEKLALDA